MTRTLLHSGRIFTAGDEPVVTSLLVEDGRVLWTGDDVAVAGADELVDLDGALVTPAFVDAHTHTTETGLALRGVDLTDSPSLADALDRVALAARAGAGRPVLGHGWDERRWPEGRPPTRAELDRASYGGVVYLSRVDVHSAVVSSALAAAAHLRELSGWADDGRVERDAHHAARTATRDGIGPGLRRELQVDALSAAAATGIGCVHEMSAPHIASEQDLRELLALSAERPDLPMVAPYRGQLVTSADEARAVAERLAVPGAAPVLGLAGDLCADGSIGSHTAALRAPYSDAVTSGHAYLTVEQVAAHVAACTTAGLAAGFHVIGDQAVDLVLAGFAAAVDRVGLDAVRAGNHRLEHVEMADDAAVAELARLGLTASVQPVFDAWWGGDSGLYAERLGTQRGPRLNRFADLHAAGVPLFLGSDTPVTPYDPWGALRACVHHHDPGQRVDLRTALGWHTGSLRPGRVASYAVWNVPGGFDDPDGELPDVGPGVPDPECLLTVVRGTVAYQREGALA
ncbi:MAG: amidohydrolase [Actinomycetales bacterium]